MILLFGFNCFLGGGGMDGVQEAFEETFIINYFVTIP